MKVSELIIKMIFLSWILGIIFFYFTIYVGGQELDPDVCSDQSFIDYNFKDEDICIKKKNLFEQIVIMFYFITTTLSTVGFGDFRPISDFERLEIVPYLLFGYLLFSYMNSQILTLTYVIRDQMASIYDYNGLNLFVKTLKSKYNEG